VKWTKRGLIFEPQGQHDWLATHAALPVADHVEGNIYRVYFSGRDDLNRSRIGFVVIEINDSVKVLDLSANPVLDIGSLGAFDDSGVSPTWILNHAGRKFLYYLGWNKRSLVRFAEVSGLAHADIGGNHFTRYSRAPILERTDREPYQILVVSCVLIENGLWRMWYDSADAWQNPDLPKYNIKYAESHDGIVWRRDGTVSVDYANDREFCVSRASVIREGGTYRMWFCYASTDRRYRIGYADSEDGLRFTRRDNLAGIDVSEHGWDSEMICYPNVIIHAGQKIMFYNGNSYGLTGFGYATM
jgi:hypothetical protein